MQVVEAFGAIVVSGQLISPRSPLPEKEVSSTPTPSTVTLPMFVTVKTNDTWDPTESKDATLDDFDSATAGCLSSGTVVRVRFEFTVLWALSVAEALAGLTSALSVSRSCCDTEYVEVHVTEEFGAMLVAEHVAGVGLPEPLKPPGVIDKSVRVRVPEFVAVNVYVTVDPTCVRLFGDGICVRVRDELARTGVLTLSEADTRAPAGGAAVAVASFEIVVRVSRSVWVVV